MSLQEVSSSRCFGGWQKVFTHRSDVLDCDMRLGVYLPPQAESGPCPTVYWLSGLTCTEQNFITKAGAQRVAAELGLVLVAPDTSPRGVGIDGEDGHWDFGSGAGYYVDASEAPWAAHYRMYSYITAELPGLVEAQLPVGPGLRSVMGHSMGGHGALIVGLKNPGVYRAISAISPICALSSVPWGHKALGAFLGVDTGQWARWDAAALVRSNQAAGVAPQPLLVDQGLADGFLAEQLRPELLEAACEQAGHPLELRRHDGYDHGFYFISTVIEDHLRWHSKALGN